MRKRTLYAALAVAVAGLFGAAPAEAQDYPDYRFDIGINGGVTGFTASLDDEHLNQDENARFEAGWLTGAQVTGWITPSIGLRANMTYTERPLNEGGFFDMGDDNNLLEDVNLWTGSGDLLFRFGSPAGMARPFLALGLGIAHVNPAGGMEVGDTEANPFMTSDGQAWAATEDNKLMGLVGLGTDIRMSDNFAVRLEVGDRMWDSPLYAWTGTALNEDEDVGNVVHQLYGQVGAHLLLGLEQPEVVAVAPAPPAPEPEPEPEPEPVEERIAICVIDPGAEAGIRTVEAIYLPETRDTMVVRNGTRTQFRTTVPRVTVANEADWFVRGEPLAFTYAPNATVEYTTWQSARMIDANQLTYLGTHRGLPVYASTDDVRDFRNNWMEARRAETTGDIDDILEDRAELAAELEEVQYLYVPLQPTGCVFQTVRVVEQVQKK